MISGACQGSSTLHTECKLRPSVPPRPHLLLLLLTLCPLQAGRPKRLSVDEAKLLESQWQDFGECAARVQYAA